MDVKIWFAVHVFCVANIRVLPAPQLKFPEPSVVKVCPLLPAVGGNIYVVAAAVAEPWKVVATELLRRPILANPAMVVEMAPRATDVVPYCTVLLANLAFAMEPASMVFVTVALSPVPINVPARRGSENARAAV